jgi:hypothetical protein
MGECSAIMAKRRDFASSVQRTSLVVKSILARPWAEGSAPIRLAKRRLRFPAKGDVIVEVEIIVPGFHILPGLTDIADAFGKKLQRFHIAIGAALIVISAPLLDFPRRAFMRSVLLDPRQRFAVAFSGREFRPQCLGRNSGKAKEVMVHRVVVFVFAGQARNVGAALIEHACEHDVAAESHSGAAGRTLGEIRRGIRGCVHKTTYQCYAFSTKNVNVSPELSFFSRALDSRNGASDNEN